MKNPRPPGMPRKKRFRDLSFNRMIPNILTLLALAAGLTAIRFGLEGRWEHAVLAIFVAAVLDALDGRIARLLKGASKFGAELDSLSDMISFGVAPAVLLYSWNLKTLGGFGWIIALAFTVCCALRLARFNSKLDDDDEPRRKAGFLTGLPAPVAAGLGLMPVMVMLEYGNGFFTSPEFVGVYTALLCFGMVSKIPTYAFRGLIIRREYLVHTLLLVSLFAAAVTAYAWQPFIFAGLFYLLTIPVSVYRFHVLNKSS